ncbi:MAG TPA: hypothetical protein ENK32_06525 [Anaerolineae bacterium]|nr:hypothetical protein [Anaerolineae bacterium]
MATIEHQLTTRLYRIICPDPLRLGEYQLDLLPSGPNKHIKRHLKHCPHCRRELRQLTNYLPDPLLDHAPSLSQRIKIRIAQRVSSEPAPDMPLPGRPTFALRGEEDDAGPLFYQAGDVQLTLEVQDDPEHPGYKMILGLVLGTALSKMEAHLWQGERPLTANPVDESGNFIFSRLAAGQYDLILAGSDVEIHVPDLQIMAD